MNNEINRSISETHSLHVDLRKGTKGVVGKKLKKRGEVPSRIDLDYGELAKSRDWRLLPQTGQTSKLGSIDAFSLTNICAVLIINRSAGDNTVSTAFFSNRSGSPPVLREKNGGRCEFKRRPFISRCDTLSLPERIFQPGIPRKRLVLEPAGIKIWRRKERPCLSRMPPIQDFEPQVRFRRNSFQCRWPKANAIGIRPTRARRILLARQKCGSENPVRR
jgi:hypothetical protein